MSTTNAAVGADEAKPVDDKPVNGTLEHHPEGNSDIKTASMSRDGNAPCKASQRGRGGDEIEFWACARRGMPYTFGAPPESSSPTDTRDDAMLKEAKLTVPKMHDPASARVWTRRAGLHLNRLAKKYKPTHPALKQEMVALKGLVLLARRSYVAESGKLVFRKITIVRLNSYTRTLKQNRHVKNGPNGSGSTSTGDPKTVSKGFTNDIDA